MSLLAFARRHLATELPTVVPWAAGVVDPLAFVVRQSYLGSSVIFLDRGGQPAVIYKAATEPSLNRFFHNAATCGRRAAALAFATQPVHAEGTFGKRAFLVLGWIPGTPLNSDRGSLTLAEPPFADAIETVTQLHLRSANTAGPDRDALVERVRWWSQLLLELPGLPRSLRANVEGCFGALLVRAAELPGVLMHGDYVAVNLLFNGGRGPALIDWEMSLPSGPPGLDLVTLMVDARLKAMGDGLSSAFCGCFLENDADRRRCWDVLEGYGERLGLSSATLPLLVGCAYLKMVAEQRHFLLLHHGPSRSARTLVELPVLEELVDRFLTSA